MIITVTAPKIGLGQTTTAINLAAIQHLVSKDRVLLVDIDKHSRDIEYFLSDTCITKGLDEFIGLYGAGLLGEESFKSCVKCVKEGIDIMAPNECLELSNNIVENLVKYSSRSYGTTIIDSIGGNVGSTRLFFKHSDVILVVLNQSKNIVGLAAQNSIYREYSEKIIFVLNKHMTSYEKKKVQYTIQDVEADLQSAGFDCPLFPLAYNIDILNESNDHSILNLVLNKRTDNTLYRRQLKELVHYMTGTGDEDEDRKRVFGTVNARRQKLFGLI